MDVTSEALCFTSARHLAARIQSKQVSAREVMSACLAQIDRLNPELNAIVGRLDLREVMSACLAQIDRLNPELNAIVGRLDDAECLTLADHADRTLARGEQVGPLHGLPTAFKDMEPAIGLPFTRGSPIYRDQIATEDSVLVERIRRAGAIGIGKTNVPEFAMGSHTYNNVYGTTRNPYDPSRSAGGSSGGAAVAVTTGMLPFADGGDLGGSLRNPANFNNIVALRPSVGLVPVAPTSIPFVGVSVKGALARSVGDVAFLLSVIAGADVRDPVSYRSDPAAFAGALERDFEGTRVAWCPDLGGLPLDRRVREVLESQRRTFEDLGCIVEDAAPDFGNVDEMFFTLRAWATWNVYGALLAQHREQLKPEAIWEMEQGARFSGADVAKALIDHGQLLERIRKFQERYEFLVCAVNQVPPFDATLPWPREIDGVEMDTYISWMKSAYWISATCRPAISVPAGFTSDGLPVGVQIVGRFRDDLNVLKLAHAFEQSTQFGLQRPHLI